MGAEAAAVAEMVGVVPVVAAVVEEELELELELVVVVAVPPTLMTNEESKEVVLHANAKIVFPSVAMPEYVPQ
jgi:hypothetical protein